MATVSSPHCAGRITAVLGPTNTGKTHLAVERLLGHASGVIGLPLRLLAREIYDRVVAVKGTGAVALVTGEEKIVPPNATHFVCTVEAMPTGRSFDFLAIDEVQLCADPERGHVFTNRLLHARGAKETMFMGADTIRPLIARLVPDAEYISRPRLSSLTYAGPKKLSRLPRRSAVVAFSATDVYTIAELIRRQRGGAAVVMGALSPRTRNAQVAMYQAGEVDFLVATDAIGMGLNMSVDHVAFASTRKFDGIGPRDLRPEEIGQIAGRAGRHMNDGTFGTTADAAELDADLVERVEEHRFQRLHRINWRNSNLDMTDLDALMRSLDAAPPDDCLMRVREPVDQMALKALARDDDIRAMTKGRAAVARLWQVCQIPDFRKVMPDVHARLLGRIYRHLMGDSGVLDNAWLERQISLLDRTDGDIDTLANRIAHIRTWTFVSHRGDWLDNAPAWQERTRVIEDKLSDALHASLTQRFVDRRTATLVRRLRDRQNLTANVGEDGDVMVEDHFIGHLHGLRFAIDENARGTEGKALRAAAKHALGREINSRAERLLSGDAATLKLTHDGRIFWGESPVAKLHTGDTPLRPRLSVIADELLDSQLRVRVDTRLREWLVQHVSTVLAPLERLVDAKLGGAGRGLAYRLTESLGTADRAALNDQIALVSKEDRQSIWRLGIRMGTESIYVPALLKPQAAGLTHLLWRVYHDKLTLPPSPAPGLVSVETDRDLPPDYYAAAGFRPFGPRAIRVDMAERLAFELRKLARQGPFRLPENLMSLVGSPRDEFTQILKAFGYRIDSSGEEPVFVRQQKRKGKKPVDRDKKNNPGRQNAKSRQSKKAKKPAPAINEDSPFAVLKELTSK